MDTFGLSRIILEISEQTTKLNIVKRIHIFFNACRLAPIHQNIACRLIIIAQLKQIHYLGFACSHEILLIVRLRPGFRPSQHLSGAVLH